MSGNETARRPSAVIARSRILLNIRLGNLMNFHRIATGGLDTSMQRCIDATTTTLVGHYQQQRGGEPTDLDLERIRRRAHEECDHAMYDFAQTIMGTGLITLHSVVDVILNDLIKLTFAVDPEGWKHELEKSQLEKVKLKDLIEDPKEYADRVMKRRLSALTKEWCNKSIPSRIDRLHALCDPKPGWWSANPAFVYERERLLQIDARRHQLVHEPHPWRQLQNVQEEMRYLHVVCMMVIAMVEQRYGLQPDGEGALDAVMELTSWPPIMPRQS